jgi:hypothetical protein
MVHKHENNYTLLGVNKWMDSTRMMSDCVMEWYMRIEQGGEGCNRAG